jgi:ribA/ribD-fused uncharacterized protein
MVYFMTNPRTWLHNIRDAIGSFGSVPGIFDYHPSEVRDAIEYTFSCSCLFVRGFLSVFFPSSSLPSCETPDKSVLALISVGAGFWLLMELRYGIVSALARCLRIPLSVLRGSLYGLWRFALTCGMAVCFVLLSVKSWIRRILLLIYCVFLKKDKFVVVPPTTGHIVDETRRLFIDPVTRRTYELVPDKPVCVRGAWEVKEWRYVEIDSEGNVLNRLPKANIAGSSGIVPRSRPPPGGGFVSIYLHYENDGPKEVRYHGSGWREGAFLFTAAHVAVKCGFITFFLSNDGKSFFKPKHSFRIHYADDKFQTCSGNDVAAIELNAADWAQQGTKSVSPSIYSSVGMARVEVFGRDPVSNQLQSGIGSLLPPSRLDIELGTLGHTAAADFGSSGGPLYLLNLGSPVKIGGMQIAGPRTRGAVGDAPQNNFAANIHEINFLRKKLGLIVEVECKVDGRIPFSSSTTESQIDRRAAEEEERTAENEAIIEEDSPTEIDSDEYQEDGDGSDHSAESGFEWDTVGEGQQRGGRQLHGPKPGKASGTSDRRQRGCDLSSFCKDVGKHGHSWYYDREELAAKGSRKLKVCHRKFDKARDKARKREQAQKEVKTAIRLYNRRPEAADGANEEFLPDQLVYNLERQWIIIFNRLDIPLSEYTRTRQLNVDHQKLARYWAKVVLGRSPNDNEGRKVRALVRELGVRLFSLELNFCREFIQKGPNNPGGAAAWASQKNAPAPAPHPKGTIDPEISAAAELSLPDRLAIGSVTDQDIADAAASLGADAAILGADIVAKLDAAADQKTVQAETKAAKAEAHAALVAAQSTAVKLTPSERRAKATARLMEEAGIDEASARDCLYGPESRAMRTAEQSKATEAKAAKKAGLSSEPVTAVPAEEPVAAPGTPIKLSPPAASVPAKPAPIPEDSVPDVELRLTISTAIGLGPASPNELARVTGVSKSKVVEILYQLAKEGSAQKVRDKNPPMWQAVQLLSAPAGPGLERTTSVPIPSGATSSSDPLLAPVPSVAPAPKLTDSKGREVEYAWDSGVPVVRPVSASPVAPRASVAPPAGVRVPPVSTTIPLPNGPVSEAISAPQPPVLDAASASPAAEPEPDTRDLSLTQGEAEAAGFFPFYEHGEGKVGRELSNHYTHANFEFVFPTFCAQPWLPHSVSVNAGEVPIMLCKAALMGNKDVFFEILALDPDADYFKDDGRPTTYCKVVKGMGRTIKPFDKELWDIYVRAVAAAVAYQKFAKVKGLRDVLLRTGDLIVLEATDEDQIWATGLDRRDRRNIIPSQHVGPNLLGHSLMYARKKLSSGTSCSISSSEHAVGIPMSAEGRAPAITVSRPPPGLSQEAIAAAEERAPYSASFDGDFAPSDDDVGSVVVSDFEDMTSKLPEPVAAPGVILPLEGLPTGVTVADLLKPIPATATTLEDKGLADQAPELAEVLLAKNQAMTEARALYENPDLESPSAGIRQGAKEILDKVLEGTVRAKDKVKPVGRDFIKSRLKRGIAAGLLMGIAGWRAGAPVTSDGMRFSIPLPKASNDSTAIDPDLLLCNYEQLDRATNISHSDLLASPAFELYRECMEAGRPVPVDPSTAETMTNKEGEVTATAIYSGLPTFGRDEESRELPSEYNDTLNSIHARGGMSDEELVKFKDFHAPASGVKAMKTSVSAQLNLSRDQCSPTWPAHIIEQFQKQEGKDFDKFLDLCGRYPINTGRPFENTHHSIVSFAASLDGSKSAGYSAFCRPGTKAVWQNEEGAEILSYLVRCRLLLRASVGREVMALLDPKQMFDFGLGDPKQCFVKWEPVSGQKMAEGRWRIIWCASIVDVVTSSLTCKKQNRADILQYQLGPYVDELTGESAGLMQAVGMGHHEKGVERLGIELTRLVAEAEARGLTLFSADSRSFDTTVPRDALLADCMRRCLLYKPSVGIRLGEGRDARYRRYTMMRDVWITLCFCDCLNNSAHTLLIGGVIWRIEKSGITASGVLSTSAQNSFVRAICYIFCGIDIYEVQGDDAIGASGDSLLAHAAALKCFGPIEKMVERYDPAKGFDFTSHRLVDQNDGSWIAYFCNLSKSCAKLALQQKAIAADQVAGIKWNLLNSPSQMTLFRDICIGMNWPFDGIEAAYLPLRE